jgi:hypothetical protein
VLSEAEIRNQLANRLTILEAGLVFIAKEHPLPNTLGSKGYIDILAKDRFGNRVIVEVKRSNTTARQAIHEILKYAALLVANEGLSPSKVRCMIVSTEWHELLVPFAEFLNVAEIQAEGFRLRVNGGSVEGAERIEVPRLSDPVSLFRQHGAYFFQSAVARDASLTTLQSALNDSGADSFVLIALNFDGSNPAVTYPYCAYFVPIAIRNDVKAKLLTLAAEESVDDEDFDSTSFVEDSFLEMVGHRSRVVYDEHGPEVTFEIGYPEKFIGMREGGWECVQILRKGRLGAAAADDSEILRMVEGVEGQSEIRFDRVSAPRFKLSWTETRSQSENSLKGNETWLQGFEWFCDWVETELPQATLSASIYNPLQLPIGLYKLMARGDGRYLPQMELVAVSEQEGRVDILLGTLLWDGSTMPTDVDSMMASVCGGVQEYLMQLHLGTAWQLDGPVMARHGLRYGLFRLHVEKEAFRAEELVRTAEGIITRPYEERQCRQFNEFATAGAEYLSTVVSAIDRWQTGL